MFVSSGSHIQGKWGDREKSKIGSFDPGKEPVGKRSHSKSRHWEEEFGELNRCLKGGEKGNPREEGVLCAAPGPQVNEGRVLAHLPGGHTFT